MASTTSAARLRASIRRAWVLERRLEGMSYRKIAQAALDHFGPADLPKTWNERRAWLDVYHEMKQVHERREVLAEEALGLDLDRLDLMLQAIWPDVLLASPQAVQTALKIIERRAKLLGMDAPTKVAPTTPAGDRSWNPYEGMTPEELNEAIEHFNSGPETAVPPAAERAEEAPGT